MNTSKRHRLALAFTAISAAAIVPASAAAVSVTELTGAITDNMASVTTLVTAGFAVVAFFIGVKLVKKAAGKVG